MALIGINGYAGSGKDTVGIIIQYLNCINVGGVSIEEAIKDYEYHEWWLEDQSGWEIKKYAGKLKDIASHLTGIDIKKFEDQEFKKTNLDPEWNVHGIPMTVREFLQKLGTDALRDSLHLNIWINALFADYKPTQMVSSFPPPATEEEYIAQQGFPNWIITDVRFPNEAKAIKDRGGIIIRVDRPSVSAVNNHPSETSLDSWNFDYKLVNNSDIFALKTSVKQVLQHANLL
jgi:hypothetical protein